MTDQPGSPRTQIKSAQVRSKPLSPLTYLLRNKSRTIPLVGVIMLAVMLISAIVALIDSIPYSVKTIYSYAKQQLAILPRNSFDLNPDLVLKLKREAPVPIERMITCRATSGLVRSIVGKWPFVVLGLKRDDLRFFLRRMNTVSIQGRLPNPGAAEAIVSEPVARNLKLKLGSVLLSPKTRENYSPNKVIVVGIAQSPKWLMATSIEYQQMFHFPPLDDVLVYAHTLKDQGKLDRWAEREFRNANAEVFAYHMLERDTNDMFTILYKIVNVVIGVVVGVLTFLMGMLMNIYQAQRLVEFGLLQAIGYTKRELLMRTVKENVIVIVVGWLLGVAASAILLQIVDAVLMYPNAFELNKYDQAAYTYTLVVPIAILVVAMLTIVLRFRKFDPVGVVERRLV